MSQSAPESQHGSISNDPQRNNDTPARRNVFIRPQANLAYFKTIPGILKIISLVIGLIAIILIVYGFINATLFNKTTIINSCEQRYEDSCGLETKYDDQLCRESTREVCVSRMLIIPFLCIIAIVWTVTLIVLIVLLIMDLLKMKGFFLADVIGHIVAAFLVILSGLCVISYFIQVLREDACSDENIRGIVAEFFSGKKMSARSLVGSRSFAFPRQFAHFTTTTTEQAEETTTTNSTDYQELRQSPPEEFWFTYFKRQCPESVREYYYHWHFLFGGIFAVILGILYILIALFSMRARQAVRPRYQHQQYQQ